MLDVAQNTARLNSLISRYYSAEFELESKTESKFQLSQQVSESTINKNRDALELMDKYDSMEADLNNSPDAKITIDGVEVCCGAKGRTSMETFISDWKGKNPEPLKATGKFAHATDQTPGCTRNDVLADPNLINEAMTNVSKNHPKDEYCGAAPNEADYKNEDGTEKTVNGQTYQQAKAAYDAKVEEYNTKCANEWLKTEKEALVERYQADAMEIYNNEQDIKWQEAHTKWDSDLVTAKNRLQAGCDYMDGEKDAISKAKQKEQERADLEFNIEQKQLSMRESQLDQEIQGLQAEVTAIKTEIDSLKQERNSNVQSDFKLFG